MKTIYKITNITHLNGQTRTDGKYPLRINSIVCIKDEFLIEHFPAILFYIKDGSGDIKTGKCIYTSAVNRFDKTDTNLTIYTRNSIYYLELYKEILNEN